MYKKRSCLCSPRKNYRCKICDYAACDEHINFLLDDNSDVIRICSLCIEQLDGRNNCTNLYQCYMLCDVCDIFYKNDTYTTYCAKVIIDGYNNTLFICKNCYIPDDWIGAWGKLNGFGTIAYEHAEKVEKTKQNIETIQNIRKKRIEITYNLTSSFLLPDIAKIICDYVKSFRVIIEQTNAN